MAEVILAFAIFGIALAGLFPFVFTQLRLTRKLETRFQGTVKHNGNPAFLAKDYYSVPWKNPRMRSLGGAWKDPLDHPPDQSLVGGALITTDQGNALDDYSSTSVGNATRTPVTIYNCQIIYSDMSSDPQISVDLNVEAP